jgi:hypothetical protein
LQPADVTPFGRPGFRGCNGHGNYEKKNRTNAVSYSNHHPDLLELITARSYCTPPISVNHSGFDACIPRRKPSKPSHVTSSRVRGSRPPGSPAWFDHDRFTAHAMELTEPVHCPFCGQGIDLVIDTSGGSLEFTTDCEICCRPIHVRVECEPGEIHNIDVSTG